MFYWFYEQIEARHATMSLHIPVESVSPPFYYRFKFRLQLNAGLVTGIAAGTGQLTWTETSTGCASTPISVTINPIPTVLLTGPSEICIDSTTTVTPTTGGVWASSNPSVATITNAGIITGVAQGTAIFTFTSTAGCPSARERCHRPLHSGRPPAPSP